MSFLHAEINQRLEGKKLDRTKQELIPFEKQGRQKWFGCLIETLAPAKSKVSLEGATSLKSK